MSYNLYIDLNSECAYKKTTDYQFIILIIPAKEEIANSGYSSENQNITSTEIRLKGIIF